jgi:hypothetical protein
MSSSGIRLGAWDYLRWRHKVTFPLDEAIVKKQRRKTRRTKNTSIKERELMVLMMLMLPPLVYERSEVCRLRRPESHFA